MGIKGLAANFNFSAIMSTFKMAINSDDEFFIKFNLMAGFIILVLADVLKQLKEKTKKIETEQLQTEEFTTG